MPTIRSTSAALFACGLASLCASNCNLVVGAGDYAVGGDASGSGTCGGNIPLGTPSFEKLVSACALAVSCDPRLFAVTVSDCISYDYLRAFGSLACLSTISSCADYYDCQGSRVATAIECPGTSVLDTGSCSGQVATSCPVGNFGSVYNCGKVGGTCRMYATDATGDLTADCMVVPSCSETDGARHCSADNKLYTCTNGVGYGEDCTNLDATCATIGGSTECYFNAPACGTPSASCAGGVLSQCVSATPSNQAVQYNCAAAGLSCDATSAQCVDPHCGASSCTEACAADGQTLTACVGGTPVNIDCTKLGTPAGAFSRCGMDTDSSGTVYHYCY